MPRHGTTLPAASQSALRQERAIVQRPDVGGQRIEVLPFQVHAAPRIHLEPQAGVSELASSHSPENGLSDTKLEADASAPRHILAVPRIGYRLATEERPQSGE